MREMRGSSSIRDGQSGLWFGWDISCWFMSVGGTLVPGSKRVSGCLGPLYSDPDWLGRGDCSLNPILLEEHGRLGQPVWPP